MLADKGPAPIGLRQIGAGVERKAQGCDMGAQRVIRRDGLRDQVGSLRLDARIDVLAVIAVRPAVEGAVLHRRQIIRHQIGAEFVALVDDGPQRAGLRLEIRPLGLRKPLAKIRSRRSRVRPPGLAARSFPPPCRSR